MTLVLRVTGVKGKVATMALQPFKVPLPKLRVIFLSLSVLILDIKFYAGTRALLFPSQKIPLLRNWISPAQGMNALYYSGG